MSTAYKCDRCDTLYEYEKGVASIAQIDVADGGAGTFDSWSEIDLCRACALKVVDALASALSDPPEA